MKIAVRQIDQRTVRLTSTDLSGPALTAVLRVMAELVTGLRIDSYLAPDVIRGKDRWVVLVAARGAYQDRQLREDLTYAVIRRLTNLRDQLIGYEIELHPDL